MQANDREELVTANGLSKGVWHGNERFGLGRFVYSPQKRSQGGLKGSCANAY